MNEVTAILTVWKRDHLEEQITALLGQSIPPKSIIAYQCCDHLDISGVLKKFPSVYHIKSTLDLGYFGRFSIALHSSTEYTYILDDDVIPGNLWIEKCIQASVAYNAIISSSGRILPNGVTTDKPLDPSFVNRFFVGDGTPGSMNVCTCDAFVDFGCNSWFVRSRWVRTFWAIDPFTLKCGEDIHLSAVCSILKGINTIVLRQDDEAGSGNRKRNYGFDDQASWRKNGFFDMRSRIIAYLIDEIGWCPLNWVKTTDATLR
jgi:hypothetical protein